MLWKKDGRSKQVVPYAGREKGRHEITCVVCARKYIAVRLTRKYCSAYCRHLATQPKKPPVEKTCERCGSTYLSNQRKRRFCSNTCSHRAYMDKHRVAYNARMRRFQKNARKKTPWYPLLASARERAHSKKMPFALTQDWARTRWTGRCELTGLPFRVSKKHRTAFSASVDRIDSRRGYTPENSRFILWGLNLLKANDTDVELREFISKTHATICRSG